ncbi:MAG: type II toxin-antitoxin system RelE/ParE family toxin [Alphaproteobacteria bacterium]|nr:MAG: type II toxin-antitoxin system RelE/ParE family toxin [Alphaproteobacteria bacterium]
MKVRYTRTAISEVDEIFSYISERNPRSAAQVIEAVARTVRRIAQFAESAIGRRAGCPCRCCRSTSLSGFYSVENEEGVIGVIVHVRHAARLRPWE